MVKLALDDRSDRWVGPTTGETNEPAVVDAEVLLPDDDTGDAADSHDRIVWLISTWAAFCSRWLDDDEIVFQLQVASADSKVPGTCSVSVRVDWEQALASLHAQLRSALQNGALAATPESFSIRVVNQAMKSTLTLMAGKRTQPRSARLTSVEGPWIVDEMADSWRALLEDARKQPGLPIGRLAVLTAKQRRRVVQSFNESRASPSSDALMHELFEQCAARQPDAVAVVLGEESITYAQLNSKANKLAHFLRAQGVGPDILVGLLLERSVELITAMIAVLKAGGAYVPLDPAYPVARLGAMIDEAALGFVITRDELCVSARLRRLLVLDAERSAIADMPDDNLSRHDIGLSADHLAFVVFTSGSTGTPKAAMNRHRGMVNRLLAQSLIEDFGPDDICCQRVSVGFVDSVFETWGPLCLGLPLVIIPAAIGNDSRAMARLIARHGVTRLITVPSLARVMAEDAEVMRDLSGVRTWTLSGEEVPVTLLTRLQQLLPDCEFIDQYGSSEVSSDAACHRVRSAVADRVPVGPPVPNVRIYVLDRNMQPVPPGAVGEIHVAGVGVGRGYLNRPDVTAERFIPDPFVSSGSSRMYRMGDLGRWRADGRVECLGRRDHQVKIRGMRVELGEIEARILGDSDVHEAVVIARDDGLGEKHLVGYLTLTRPGAWLSEPAPSQQAAACIERLRASLRASLPVHMVPAALMILDALPRTATGKLSRQALPPPPLSAYSQTPYASPADPRERLLVELWERLLGIRGIGRLHNFFELGGHSLLAARMVRELSSHGLKVDMRGIYASANLGELASRLQQMSAIDEVPPTLIPMGCDCITPEMLTLVRLDQDQIATIVARVPGGAANVQDIYPLTPLQHGLLFHHAAGGGERDIYIRSMLLKLSSREALDRLTGALDRVIERHDMLRTAVLWENLPQPVQVVYRKASVPVEPIELDRTGDLVAQLRARMVNGSQKFSLAQAPLVRLQVARGEDGRWYALLLTHHLVFDDESLALMFAELEAHLSGQEHRLPAPGAYRQHVAHTLAARIRQDAEGFFRDRLADISEPVAPFGLLSSGEDLQPRELSRELASSLHRAVRLQAHRLEVSPAAIFHAAWALVVARTTGKSDVVFGSVLAGRSYGSRMAEHTLGMFINTLPMRLQLLDFGAAELIRRTHGELLELLEHEQVPLADAQRCSALGGGLPLFSTLLNFRHASSSGETDWTHGSGIAVLAAHERTNYPIAVSIDDTGSAFRVTTQTDARLNPERIGGYLEEALSTLLHAVAVAPDSPWFKLQVIPSAERDMLWRYSFRERTEFPRAASLGEIFEAQVRRAPEAIALMEGASSLTYAELDRLVNQFARYLIANGAKAGDRVAVCMHRSACMLVAQLAIVKLGAAYVPIDPRLPGDRMEYILRDCGAVICLTNGAEPATTLEWLDVRWLDCLRSRDAIEACSSASLGLPIDSNAPAYVMYTSGSTGRPKGVLVSHRNIAKLVINGGYARIDSSDCVAHCSNPAFDASTFEIWVALLNGARLVIVAEADVLSSSRLAAVLERDRVSVLFQTTALFNQHAAAMSEIFAGLRYLFFGGEAADVAAVREVFERGRPQHLLNMYGPTETTTYATAFEVESAPHGLTLPIGRPIANTNLYILDEHLQFLPVGVTGEIYIGGEGVAPGYLDRVGLTAERFVPDPFSSQPGARMYRTGDLGCWNSAGEIEFRGRNDQQVKLRGYRIELPEIEAHLLRCPGVSDAVVTAVKGVRGLTLVAYVSNRTGRKPDAATVRATLAATLPSYMVPAVIIVLDEMPITANGKIDRRALPQPDLQVDDSAHHAPPEGDVERVLARIWTEVLGVEHVGRNDNFFELGGHSLLAMQVISRVGAEFSLDLPVDTLFKSTDLAQLAADIEAMRDARLAAQLAAPEGDFEQLLEQITAMPESEAAMLLRQLEMEDGE